MSITPARDCCVSFEGEAHEEGCPTLAVDSDQPMPMYAISLSSLSEIEEALIVLGPDPSGVEDQRAIRGIELIRAARENGPIPDLEREAEEMARGVKEYRLDLQEAAQQRDFLLAQVGSLILRLAGANVSAGMIDLNGASGYAAREQAVINAGLAQIAERNKGDAT